MGDRDERPSFGRYSNNPDGYGIDIDMVSKMIADYEISTNQDDKEKMDILRKIESHLRNHPPNFSKAPKFISTLLSDQNTQVRKLAYKCAFHILSANRTNNKLLVDSYRLAMLNSNAQVAQFALENLPDFVMACPEEAENLARFSTAAMKKLNCPTTETEMQIAKALSLTTQ